MASGELNRNDSNRARDQL